MKILRVVSGVLMVALFCMTAASAAQTPPPDIDMTALQAYGPGTGTISAGYGQGISHKTSVDVFCAPDIPYVAWYVNQLNSPKPAPYDQRLKPFTRTAHGGPFFGHASFKCTGLASGRYLVWIEYTLYQNATFSAPSPRERTQNMNGAPPVTESNGEISTFSASRQTDYIQNIGIGASASNGGSWGWRTAPQEVVVSSGATVNVDF